MITNDNECLEWGNLVGKTIATIQRRTSAHYDDSGFLDIEFTDGTKITIHGTYGGYTGKSYDEYTDRIELKEFGFDYRE